MMPVVEAVPLDVVVIIRAASDGISTLLNHIALAMMAVMQPMRLHIIVFVPRFRCLLLFRHRYPPVR